MATSELPSESDAFAFPCGDDGTTSPALSPPVVISVLASILERHIALNERAMAAASGLDQSAPGDDDDNSDPAAAAARKRARAFDGGTVLDMSLHAFLERFSRYAHVSPQVYVVAYAYLDRLRRSAGVRVVRANAQRLLTTAILVASKFVEDRNYRNSYFAAVGGLAAAELSALELDFLFLMQFRLNVCAGVFRSYCRHLEREVSHGGWYRVDRRPLVCAGEARAQHRQAAAV